MIFIYDTKVPVHETPEGEAGIDCFLDKLDEMLTQYGVAHCFILPTNEEIEKKEEDGKQLVYWLCYESSQNTELTLIISLWLKLYRNKDTQEILKSIVKSLGKED
jgi:hypothetical protein